MRTSQRRVQIRDAVFLAFAVCMLSACQSRGNSPEDPLAKTRQSFVGEPHRVFAVNRSKFAAIYRPSTVAFAGDEAPGTLIVDTKDKLLYLVEPNHRARRYGVAVGRSGQAWKGQATVARKAQWPNWYPTDDMRAEYAGLPRIIPGGSDNPLGARALYLYSGGRDTLYRIHGTSEPWTIGTEASSGCIRMFNEDVIDLYGRISIGSTVIVR